MRARRGARAACEDLCSGPGKLTQALGIGLELNGADLIRGPIVIARRPPAWRDVEVDREHADRDHQGRRAAVALLGARTAGSCRGRRCRAGLASARAATSAASLAAAEARRRREPRAAAARRRRCRRRARRRRRRRSCRRRRRLRSPPSAAGTAAGHRRRAAGRPATPPPPPVVPPAVAGAAAGRAAVPPVAAAVSGRRSSPSSTSRCSRPIRSTAIGGALVVSSSSCWS